LIGSHFLESTLSTLSATEWLAVRSSIEGDEEEEVRGEDANSGNSSELFASALATIWEPVPVGGGEISPGCEVDEAWRSDMLVGEFEVNLYEGFLPRSMTNWMICMTVI
jgi:hypothetical protein